MTSPGAATLPGVARPAPSPEAIRHRRAERLFYTFAAIASALIVLAGFAQTYYAGRLFDAPPLPGLLHLHGAVMTLWFTFFIVQVRLVAAGRTDLHRRLGVAGSLLAAAVVGVGFLTAVNGARRGATPGPPPLQFLAVPLGDLVVFAGMTGAGLLKRRLPATHRRLMLLGSVGILTPAIARLPFAFIRSGGPFVFFGLTDLCVLACAAIDTVRNRRLHPAVLWGSLFIIASHPLRLALSQTDAWMRFAAWLAG